MKINILLFVLGMIAIYAADIRPAFRKKDRKTALVASSVVLVSLWFGISKLLGIPGPIVLMHNGLSPLGRIIWGG